MAEVALDVNSAASSPAEPQPQFEPSQWSSDEHEQWMATGAVPATKPQSPAESTPAKSAGVSKETEPTTESAPDPKQEQHKKGAESRKAELAKEIQSLLKQRADLQAEVSGKKDVKAVSSTAQDSKDGEPVAPVAGDEPLWKHLEAMAKYQKDLAAWIARKTIREERDEERKRETDRQKETRNEARLKAGVEAHKDWLDVVSSATDVPISPSMDEYIQDSDIGHELVYYICQNGDEAREISKMSPIRAARAMRDIELSLTATQKRAPVTPITKAAKPATDLKATQAVPTDERRAAIEGDDFTRYQELENARDIARRRKG